MTGRHFALLVGCLCMWSTPVDAQNKDYKGFSDPELLSCIPNFYLADPRSFDEKQFDFHEFKVQPRPPLERVEGRVRHYIYTFDRSVAGTGQPAPDHAELPGGDGKGRRTDGIRGRDVNHAPPPEGRQRRLGGGGTGQQRHELPPLHRRAGGDEAGSGLATSGHVEEPGIFFDTGKADLKPESEAALDEVIKLLQANASLRVWVVGHTDNVGTAESNVTLSNARAASVVKALQQKGVDAKRLAPHGAGPYTPVATNASEEGRAKNRRVELVAQ